jgi:hypothetical protein
MCRTEIFADEFSDNTAEQRGLLEGLRTAYQTLDHEERQRIKHLMAELSDRLQRSRIQDVQG